MGFETKIIILLLIVIVLLVIKLAHLDYTVSKVKKQQINDYKINQNIISKCNNAMNSIEAVKRILKINKDKEAQ